MWTFDYIPVVVTVVLVGVLVAVIMHHVFVGMPGGC